MHVEFAPRDVLQIDDARIIYRNFSGVGTQFNREGDRNFSIVIPTQELADELIARGWGVKIRPPRDEDDEPFMHLPVKVQFNDFGPVVYLKSGNRTPVKLDKESINILDSVEMLRVDLDIRPHDWEVNGKTGRKAYLKKIVVVQEVDRFMDRYFNDEE